MWIKYEVLTSEYLGELETLVNQKMKAGWQPLGAPIVITHPKGIRHRGTVVPSVFGQAIVR